jgi:hypothetical protein
MSSFLGSLKEKASNVAGSISDQSEKALCALGKHKFEMSNTFTQLDSVMQIKNSVKGLTGNAPTTGTYKFTVKCDLKCERCGFILPCVGELVSVT